MNPFKVIARVKPEGLWKLLKLAIPNILFLWSTYQATKNCMSISTEHFDKKHYQNGRANAFRHALWNILIAKRCMKNNVGKALEWTKKITDWHEETFFGQQLPMLMDYHNNEVGRNLLKQNLEWTNEQFVSKLLTMTDEAFKIQEESELNQYKNQLVYITDDHQG